MDTPARRPRFPGLRLSVEDSSKLDALERAVPQSRFRWRRMRILRLLNQGWSLVDVGRALGTYPREVRRVGWRYIERGLEMALRDEPRPKPSKKLDATQRSAVVAIACSPAPVGRARWTLRLLAREAVARGVVDNVSYEVIREVLHANDLKPWREKNVVRSPARQRVR